ncbi:MAG: ferrous iron transporter B [Holosporales bacterium]|jgi:ferrous iron transport protein B|nr:ferrous iron transporter B [Holosporales bacterium]
MQCGHCSLGGGGTDRKLAIVGNPNVGKTSIFNMLSGRYAEVSNYPGTSVSIEIAKIHLGELVDTPGIYGFTTGSQLEKITKEYVDRADVILNVVNALTLDKDLVLTRQLIKVAGEKVILVLNQVDNAEQKGISIDCQELSNTLGIRVIRAIATKNIGKEDIYRAIQESSCNLCKACYLRDDSDFNNVNNILERCVTMRNSACHASISQRIDLWLLKPVIGWPVAVAVLYLLFKILGVFISQNVVDSFVSAIDTWYIPFISKYITNLLGSNVFSDMLIGEFGILTMAVKIIVGILLPLITGFYIIMSLLEDLGYIPRLSVITNRFFNAMGLNGNAIIPTLLGFGCGALGTISTRVLETRRERIITTSLISLVVPCAAQQGIIVALLASLNNGYVWFIYIITILMVMILSGSILNMMFGKTHSNFIIDIPPFRIPSLRNCYRKTVYRMKHFILDSLSFFAISSVLITVLHSTGALLWLQAKMSPVVETLLHLPKEFSDIFVMGILRRDLASVGILDMTGLYGNESILNTSQILTAAIVITLFVPCINAIVIILKEMGWKLAFALWGASFAISIIVGATLARILEIVF